MNPDKWLARMLGYRVDRFAGASVLAYIRALGAAGNGAAAYVRSFGGALLAPAVLGGRPVVLFLAEPAEEEEEPDPEPEGEGEGEGEGD